MGSGGQVISDPQLIVEELRRYWSQIFAHAPCRTGLIQAWVQDEISMPDWTEFQNNWIPGQQEMGKGIQTTGRSAPGPDGIPYAAWRHLGQLGINWLYEAAQALTSLDMDTPLCQMDPLGGARSHSFSEDNMVFLPQKVSGVHPLLGDYYSPGDVRPLVIVSTDNRIIANWFRRRWEPFFDTWTSKHQQGFLPGRRQH